MKLIWFNEKRVGNDREWEFGCVWPFFVVLAAVVAALIWWL